MVEIEDGEENVCDTSQNEKEIRAGNWMDLMGKDLRMKIINSNESADSTQTCDAGDAVRVSFVGYCANDIENEEWGEGPVFQDASDWLVVIVDKDVCPALEMGIRFLRVGESAVIQSHPKYAYGPAGRKHGDYVLPPHSSVIYRVHVASITKAESEDFLSPSFQIEYAMNKKMIGNDCYQHEWSDGYGKAKALQLYRKGSESMNRLLQGMKGNEYREQAREVMLDCLNNTAAVLIRAKQYSQAKEAATQVLIHDNANLKALCRAARAAMLDPASTYEESNAAVSAAEVAYPDDDDVKKLRAELKRRKRDYNRKSKAMFSKMSESLRPETKAPGHKSTPAQGKDEKTLDESDPPVTEDDRSWWRRYIPRFFLHGIIFALQILLYYYLKDKYGPQQQVEKNSQGPAQVDGLEF